MGIQNEGNQQQFYADGDKGGEIPFVGGIGGVCQLFNAEIPIHNIGLSEIEDDFKVEIFPNPASSIIHVIANDDAMKTVTVTDLYGRKLMERSVNAEETALEVSMLPQGVYFIKLFSQTNCFTVKFVKL